MGRPAAAGGPAESIQLKVLGAPWRMHGVCVGRLTCTPEFVYTGYMMIGGAVDTAAVGLSLSPPQSLDLSRYGCQPVYLSLCP